MGKNLLIVDDDRTLVKILVSYFNSKGFNGQAAFDGEEALMKLKDFQPNMIILDVHMPKMNGYNFILEAKKIIDLKSIPIIVLTAKEGMDDLFKLEGAREYFVKPVQPELLLELVQKYL